MAASTDNNQQGDQQQSNISLNPNQIYVGLNLDNIVSQVKPGQYTYALNGTISNFDGNAYTMQNEGGNVLCFTIPQDYRVIGTHPIYEKDLIVFWLVNPLTGDCEIGLGGLYDCIYTKQINAKCLNFDIDHPILKAEHKITDCSIEVYWTDRINRKRFIDLNNLPYVTILGDSKTNCETIITSKIDCNKLNVQPDFDIPQVQVIDVASEGQLQAGTYQFAIQYSNILGEAYTSFYSITNPVSIFDPFKVTEDFNYNVARSIVINISNIDVSGFYDYFNIVVIKTVNAIVTPYLVGTFRITAVTQTHIYTGENKAEITETIDDVFQKYPIYEPAKDLTVVGDTLIWAGLATNQDINYQQIWGGVTLQWETYRVPGAAPYADQLNVVDLKGYFRDEIYALEGCFLLKNGYQTDSFHIPGRAANATDLVPIYNTDTLEPDMSVCSNNPEVLPTWQVYNTGTNLGYVADFCKPPSYNTYNIIGTMEPICDHAGGPGEGATELVFTFTHPTPTNFTILLGFTENVGGQLYSVGYDLLGALPLGSLPHIQYLPSNLPFSMDIPAGVTSFTVTRLQLRYPVGAHSNWICFDTHLSDITEIFIQGKSSSDIINLNLTSAYHTVLSLGPDRNGFPPITPDPNCINLDDCYNGPWEYGEFAYWESTEKYPCNEFIWGDLANQPIRHHKFPDSRITHIHDNNSNIFPLGIKIDLQQINNLINASNLTQEQKDNIVGFKILRGNRDNNKSIVARGLISNVGKYINKNADTSNIASRDGNTYFFPNYPFNDVSPDPFLANTSYDEDSLSRYTFHSPDTSFYQPSLGNILKLETAEFGKSTSHFVQVLKHARYKFISENAFEVALGVSIAIGLSSASHLTGQLFDGTAAMTTYAAFLDIIEKLIPKINPTYSFNSVGTYDNFIPIQNTGNKQRLTDIAVYATPGMLSIGDTHNLNNFEREGSIYLRTIGNNPFPYVSGISGVPTDNSRYLPTQEGTCANLGNITSKDISSYYATIKNNFVDQYGQLYSYQTIDTGYQKLVDLTKNLQPNVQFDVIFGGDCFINQFAYKCKLPFFIDNRVGDDDESDIFYDEIGNVGIPRFWFTTDVTKGSGRSVLGINLGVLFGVRSVFFDCQYDNFFYNSGTMYLFAYGIQNFYTESQVNVDLRQAYNNKEGDFYPHVGSGIPDTWLQESNVSIAFDNTYWYNKSYSKQNEENFFSHIPEDFDGNECRTQMPFRAIFSEKQLDVVNYRRNNWLIYKPASKFDFPESYGKLTAVDSIEDKQVIVRFENKSLLYNALQTVTTSTGNAYLGRSLFDPETPPVDYAHTDLGYVGSQNRFILKTEKGLVVVDAKRGQVFLLPRVVSYYNRPQAVEISNTQVNKFLIQNLPFAILSFFPDVNIDNAFKDFGIHGVFDNKYNRIIITKLDYIPLFPSQTTYSNGIFYYTDPNSKIKKEILPIDRTYFCNNSFTISYSFDTTSWISLHSYLPNYYIGALNYFYSGINIDSNANVLTTTSTCWEHNTTYNVFNSYFGKIEPYVIEYPYSFALNDEILQNIKDYSKVLQYSDFVTYIETDDYFFNKAILWNNQQSSGVLELVKKPKNNLYLQGQYPQYGLDSKTILFTKSDSYYQFNTFWALNKTAGAPMWIKSCESVSVYKDINQDNMSYGKRSYNKAPIRGRDLKVRLILDNRSDLKMISEFILSPTEKSYK